MGSRNIWPSSVPVLSLCVVVLLCRGLSAREVPREAVCGDELLTLECGNRSVIAVHEAIFTHDVTGGNFTCDSSAHENITDGNNTCREEDIRSSLNRRCSGLNQCNYTHAQDGEQVCDGSRGAVVVRYNCIKESSLHKYCNMRLQSKEGYIASPGFPLYYPRLSACNWTIEAPDGQTVLLRFLHVHMRLPTNKDPNQDADFNLAPHHHGKEQCDDDYVRIVEGHAKGTKRLTVCGEGVDALQSVDVEANKGPVIQFYSREFYPASGFLLYYKVKGCPTLPAPEDGYLVHRNGSTAVYHCCKKRLFNDTLEHSRTLYCVGDHRWNDTLAPCTAVEELRQIYVNRSLDLDFENMTNDESASPVLQANPTYIEDILIPSLLMGVLVIGNAIIVAIIIGVRRKQKSKLEVEEDEFSQDRPLPLVPEVTNV